VAERNPTTKGTRRSAPSSTGKGPGRFTGDERAAMRERAQELKTAASCHRQGQRAGPLAEDLVRHAGMRQGRQCRLLFQSAQKFKTRYATLGFSDKATSTTADVADLLRIEGAHYGGRGKDHRTCEKALK